MKKKKIMNSTGTVGLSVNKSFIMFRLWDLRFYITLRTPMKMKPGKRRAHLRQVVYDREGGICEHCGRQLTLDDMSVHHVLGQAMYPHLRFDESNCQCLCHDCHSALHRELQMKENARLKEAEPVLQPQ